MHESTCQYCARPITSDRGGPGALWDGIGFLDDPERRVASCDKNESDRWRSAYGPHRPAVFPDEVEAAIASIRKDT